MKTLHALEELPDTPVTADDVGKVWLGRVYRHVIRSCRSYSAAQLEVDLARTCKHGRATINTIRNTPAFKAARFLCW